MTARRPAATLVVKFADGSTFRLTTALGDWHHGAALAGAAWRSRRQTDAEPPAVVSMHFEDGGGAIIACRPENAPAAKPRRGRNAAPPPEMTVAERAALLAAIGRMKFVFAKTLWRIPHQWVARRQSAEADYVLLFNSWKTFGVWGSFTGPNGRSSRYKYLRPGDGFRYWAMTTHLEHSLVINRTREENAEEYFAEDMKRAAAEMEAKAARRHKP